MRYLIFAAALVSVAGFAVLTALYLASNGITFVGVIGVIVVVICGVGILGALLQSPRR